MTFDEYGMSWIVWRAPVGLCSDLYPSDAFLDVGTTEEPVGDGSRFTRHGVFRIQSEQNSPRYSCRVYPFSPMKLGRSLLTRQSLR